MRGSLLFLLSALSAACDGTLPPLRGHAEIGRDRYLIFVGGSGPAGGDLYAVLAEGGEVVPITFTNVGEMSPALSPDGGAVAFLRGRSLRDSTPATVWVLNLLTGAERDLALPRGAGKPLALGWLSDGRSLVVRTEGGIYRLGAPPDPPSPRRVADSERAAAESSLAVLLGDPVFGRVVPCADPEDLCVAGDSGAPGLLVHDSRYAARWGSDSVAYLVGGAVEVRPLGPGHARRLNWSNPPTAPRQLTAFTGPRLP